MKTISKRALELYNRINSHLLFNEKPSLYLESLSGSPDFDGYPFSMLEKLRETEQSPRYHPEGSVWEHTMLCVDSAAAHRGDSHEPRAFMWAALLHDIGKPQTTRNVGGKITSYDHDRAGAEFTRGFLSEFTDDEDFITRTAALVRYHMHILYVTRSLPFADLEGLSEHTDIREVALLGLCDRLGRVGADEEYERRQIRMFLERCGLSAKKR